LHLQPRSEDSEGHERFGVSWIREKGANKNCPTHQEGNGRRRSSKELAKSYNVTAPMKVYLRDKSIFLE